MCAIFALTWHALGELLCYMKMCLCVEPEAALLDVCQRF